MDGRPGRDAQREVRAKSITLVPVSMPHPADERWVPAGSDRRRTDRREPSSDADRTAPDRRRRNDRRKPPERTVTVYRVVDEAATLVRSLAA